MDVVVERPESGSSSTDCLIKIPGHKTKMQFLKTNTDKKSAMTKTLHALLMREARPEEYPCQDAVHQLSQTAKRIRRARVKNAHLSHHPPEVHCSLTM